GGGGRGVGVRGGGGGRVARGGGGRGGRGRRGGGRGGLLPEASAGAIAPPADLLHGLGLCPPAARWDGARYRGSALESVNLGEARAQAGVVAVVRREHFVGVVAVTPAHARQALACMAPVWRGDGPPAREETAAPSEEDSDGDREYLWRSAETASGARVAAWCLDGRLTLWLPPPAAASQAWLRRELAALVDCWPLYTS
ncbi:hypothetical protein HGQ98_32620, partial [Achromobacter ruhlandii]|nr:hypothetical protein [Achromobacter ruhlandii]